MKKFVVILAAVMLAPLIVVNLVRAAGDWRTVGQTASGDKVSVSSMRVLKNNQRTALVRVEYKEPPQLPKGGPFVEMRARVRVYCSSGQVVPSAIWFYTRDRGGRAVVSKKAAHDDQFANRAEGGFVELVSKSVCAQQR